MSEISALEFLSEFPLTRAVGTFTLNTSYPSIPLGYSRKGGREMNITVPMYLGRLFRHSA